MLFLCAVFCVAGCRRAKCVVGIYKYLLLTNKSKGIKIESRERIGRRRRRRMEDDDDGCS
jgi:hypothetical protein